MIPIKEISELPQLDWSDHALFEMAQSGVDLISHTQAMFQLGEVCIAGLIYTSFTSPPWFWFALARGVGIRDLIDFRAAAKRIPWGTHTAVREDYGTGQRFAEFYGFVPTGEAIDYHGALHHIYRKEG